MRKQKIQLLILLTVLVILIAGYVAAGKVSSPETTSEHSNKTMSEIVEESSEAETETASEGQSSAEAETASEADTSGEETASLEESSTN